MPAPRPLAPETVPQLKWMETFLTAAECRNYATAGEILGITKASVSLHIKSLEAHLETDLFKRARKGQPLERTEAGEYYLKRLRQTLEEIVPNYIADQTPVILRQPLDKACPDIRDFLDQLKKLNYRLGADPVSHKLLTKCIKFRMVDGRWIYDWIGRRSSFVGYFGERLAKAIIGLHADRAQPSGTFNDFEYDICHAYHLACQTNEPVLETVECYIASKDGTFNLTRYQKMTVKAWDQKGEIALVWVAMNSSTNAEPFSDTSIEPLPLDQFETSDSSQLTDLLANWQNNRLVSSPQLQHWLEQAVLLRPLLPEDRMIYAHIGHNSLLASLYGRNWCQDSQGALFVPGRLGSDFNRVLFTQLNQCLADGSPCHFRINSRGSFPDGHIRHWSANILLLRVYFGNGAPAILLTASPPDLSDPE